MNALRRQLYGFIVGMHPAPFRDEFGCEMIFDFDDASGSKRLAVLYFDALLSLGRQWTRCVFPETAESVPIQPQSLLAGHYVMVRQGCLTVFDLARASVLATALLLVTGVAATTPNSGVLAVVQIMSAGQDGGFGNVKGDRLLVDGKVSLSAAEVGGRRIPDVKAWRREPKMKTISSAEPTPVNHMWQWTAFAFMAWLTMLLLLRKPSIGRKMVLTGLGFLAIAAPVHAQILHASGPLPSFEVATVRPWQPPPAPLAPDGSAVLPKMKFAPGAPGGQRTDRVNFIGEAVLLIASAYNIPFGKEGRMIVGAPGWAGSQAERYQVQAKIEDAQFVAMKAMTPAEQRQQVSLMEQSLLADRFKLKVHFETREMAVYSLVVAKGGSKLTLAKDGETSRLSSEGKAGGVQITGVAVTLQELANAPFLGLNGAQVVDQTGLPGRYDFTLDWSAGEAGVAADAPGLMTAIQEQLGLRLVASKAQVEVVVIDHIERPSGN